METARRRYYAGLIESVLRFQLITLCTFIGLLFIIIFIPLATVFVSILIDWARYPPLHNYHFKVLDVFATMDTKPIGFVWIRAIWTFEGNLLLLLAKALS